jgi:hypothetical protein
MLSRIVYTFDDEKMNNNQIWYFLAVQIIGLAPLTKNCAWVGLLLFVMISIGLVILLEKKSDNFTKRKTEKLRIIRIISLFVYFIIYLLIIHLTGEISFSPMFLTGVNKIIDSVSIIKDLGQLSQLNIYLLGFLFIINEANLIIRQVFDWIKIKPELSEKGKEEVEETHPSEEQIKIGESKLGKVIVDTSPNQSVNDGHEVETTPPSDKYLRIDEYKSGRVIGILERSIVYLAMLSNEYSIIGFILAAKAFARFKELDKKVYAEYVLIGTLASILIALVAASFISVFIPKPI